MTISIGDKIPSVKLKRIGPDGMEEVDVAEYVRGKKVVLFAIPGAFTPTCTERHLPSYVENAGRLKDKGIDEIICIAVNDPFVMRHFSQTSGAEGKITMLPDGNADFTRALGLEMDGSGFGLGTRSKRYSMLLEDGMVRDLEVEPAAGEVTVSGADACLTRL